MGYSDIIAREAETLPVDKQVEILDFIAFLKTRKVQTEIASAPTRPQTAGEVEAFFRSFDLDTRGYRFDRDDANAK